MYIIVHVRIVTNMYIFFLFKKIYVFDYEYKHNYKCIFGFSVVFKIFFYVKNKNKIRLVK